MQNQEKARASLAVGTHMCTHAGTRKSSRSESVSEERERARVRKRERERETDDGTPTGIWRRAGKVFAEPSLAAEEITRAVSVSPPIWHTRRR